uniref:Uncharacterized protein n=1 Tax=Pipistrellus kuhlii TaxID=59472 RepID=A0A7J7UTI5_PIPKU|nr:hypothetical protein mPipKuh1_008716 [Pipistrellus kuhlii]
MRLRTTHKGSGRTSSGPENYCECFDSNFRADLKAPPPLPSPLSSPGKVRHFLDRRILMAQRVAGGAGTSKQLLVKPGLHFISGPAAFQGRALEFAVGTGGLCILPFTAPNRTVPGLWAFLQSPLVRPGEQPADGLSWQRQERWSCMDNNACPLELMGWRNWNGHTSHFSQAHCCYVQQMVTKAFCHPPPNPHPTPTHTHPGPHKQAKQNHSVFSLGAHSREVSNTTEHPSDSHPTGPTSLSVTELWATGKGVRCPRKTPTSPLGGGVGWVVALCSPKKESLPKSVRKCLVKTSGNEAEQQQQNLW